MIDPDPHSVDSTPNAPRFETGVSLPLVALMMVALLGIAAFAVDLGWFYLSASRIQRAADASSLAGVIHMPNDPTRAANVAHDIARSNGYEDLGIPGTYPTVVAVAVPLEPTHLRVTVTEEVPTFFLKVFGMSSQVITRTAQAEFVPPLPLGSPENQFGNSCNPTQAGCVGQPNFWANIHGRYTDTISGDAFSSACLGKTGPPCNGSDSNPTFRDDLSKRPGYLYGIDPNGALSFTVQFNDIVFRNTSGGLPTGDHIRTGDHICATGAPATCGPTVRVALFPPDTTPLDVTDGTPICTEDIVPQPQVAEADPYPWDSPKSCFIDVPAEKGIYVLQVRILDTGPDPVGLNRYAVRSLPDTTRLYAIGDMSIFNNSTASVTSFHLAEVSDIYAGKTFVVELYDAGDSDEAGTLQVIAPGGGVFNGTCRIYKRTSASADWVQLPSPALCEENVAVQEYNGHWLKFEMDLPSDYSCTDCWWKMNYVYPGGTQDTTTWRAYILGNPIHLVPTS